MDEKELLINPVVNENVIHNQKVTLSPFVLPTLQLEAHPTNATFDPDSGSNRYPILDLIGSRCRRWNSRTRIAHWFRLLPRRKLLRQRIDAIPPRRRPAQEFLPGVY
jgi:hypothetical protein